MDSLSGGEWVADTIALEEEVKATLYSFSSNKSPDPDGFTSEFFKKFWPELKDTTMKCVRQDSKPHLHHTHA